MEFRREIAKEFKNGGGVGIQAIDETVIGEPEEMPTRPDTKDHIDQELGFIAAQSNRASVMPGYNHGGEALSLRTQVSSRGERPETEALSDDVSAKTDYVGISVVPRTSSASRRDSAWTTVS